MNPRTSYDITRMLIRRVVELLLRTILGVIGGLIGLGVIGLFIGPVGAAGKLVARFEAGHMQ